MHQRPSHTTRSLRCRTFPCRIKAARTLPQASEPRSARI